MKTGWDYSFLKLWGLRPPLEAVSPRSNSCSGERTRTPFASETFVICSNPQDLRGNSPVLLGKGRAGKKPLFSWLVLVLRRIVLELKHPQCSWFLPISLSTLSLSRVRSDDLSIKSSKGRSWGLRSLYFDKAVWQITGRPGQVFLIIHIKSNISGPAWRRLVITRFTVSGGLCRRSRAPCPDSVVNTLYPASSNSSLSNRRVERELSTTRIVFIRPATSDFIQASRLEAEAFARRDRKAYPLIQPIP
jgi:hypothetical protein